MSQQVEVDARLVVETLEIGLRDQVHQVSIAGFVLCDQQQVADGVEATLVALPPLLLEARARRHVHLAADDGLDVVTSRRFVELDGPEEVAVIRHTHGGHPQGLRALEERIDLDGTVQQ